MVVACVIQTIKSYWNCVDDFFVFPFNQKGSLASMLDFC